MSNRHRETKQYKKHVDAWNISKKYSQILIDQEDDNENLNTFFTVHSQFISELENRKLETNKKKIYIQCWNTVLNTLLNNPKIKCQRASIKLLHQTNVQRTYKR